MNEICMYCRSLIDPADNSVIKIPSFYLVNYTHKTCAIVHYTDLFRFYWKHYPSWIYISLDKFFRYVLSYQSSNKLDYLSVEELIFINTTDSEKLKDYYYVSG